MSTQFYQKWWFWLIAAALIYFIFYTTYNGHDAIKSKTVSMPLETASSQQAENITVQDKVYTPEQSTPSSTNLDLKPKDDFDKIIDKIGQVITFNNGSKIKLKEAAPGELLGKREIAVYKKEKLMSCVEGIRLGEMFIDRYGTYHIIVDVSVINFSHSEFTLTNRNFTLIDNDSQYTYRPSIYLPNKFATSKGLNGDLQGVLKYGEQRRGEISFEVPSKEIGEFTLRTYLGDTFADFDVDVHSILYPPDP